MSARKRAFYDLILKNYPTGKGIEARPEPSNNFKLKTELRICAVSPDQEAGSECMGPRIATRLRTLIAGLLFWASAANAGSVPTLDEANQLLQNSKWPEAVAAFQALAKNQPDNGQVWTGLGEAQLQSKELGPAAESFKKAEALGYRPVVNQVNEARVASLQGDAAKVYQLFDSIIKSGNGGRVRPIIAGSPEFNNLTKDPTFIKYVKEQMASCVKPEYRQFDFWAGEWDVQDPAGIVVGHNLVTSEQDGCLLVEHWTSIEGIQTGTSFNYYDIRDKKWHQLYLDNSGNAGAFPAMSGELTDGRMVLYTAPGPGPFSRWTWAVVPGKGVRQMAEQSTDSGKTWQTTWDSIYVKVQ